MAPVHRNEPFVLEVRIAQAEGGALSCAADGSHQLQDRVLGEKMLG